jgi:hypothetical protein
LEGWVQPKMMTVILSLWLIGARGRYRESVSSAVLCEFPNLNLVFIFLVPM